MKTIRKRSWAAVAVLAAVLCALLAFFYLRTQDYDESNYFANVTRLRQIKQLDARWELDALKSKIGVNAHYDPLVTPLLDLRQLLLELGTEFAVRESPDKADLISALAALDRTLQEKTRLVERFKSHNAVLHNSLAFLPGAAEELRQAAGAVRGNPHDALRRFTQDINQVLLATLIYNQDGGSDKADEIAVGLDKLAADNRFLATGAGEGLDIFAAHVRTVLREQGEVNGLLRQFAAIPVAARIDDIDNLLAGEEQRAVGQFQEYRQYLLAFSALLAALLLYAAFGLIRSHGVIRRVNHELQGANERLEDRVRQRTAELQEAHAKLVATARQAGMAEIATNVLHNVGNVLNSVNVSAGLIASQLRASRAAGLARAVGMMEEHAADLGDFLTHDEKGKRLPEYLNKLSAALAAEQAGMLAEIGQLAKSIEHIADIVATQQSYAGPSRLVEPIQIRELVDDALRMNAASLVRHEVTVVKEIAELPELPLDRHQVLQILVNLIRNAKQAMDGLGDRIHRLTLRVDVADDTAGAGRRLRICVADVGEGIAAENMARIFTHGFTTRRDGHGFGLHSCILAAREMGGTLTAHSDGPGLGAAFTLELPIGVEVAV